MMRILVLALIVMPTQAVETEAKAVANPVRKVVTMLQMMMNKIEAEGKKETELFDKYMCYCKTSDEELSKAIEDAETKIPQLESDIKEAEETKVKLEGDITKAQTDRTAAKDAMAKATAMRQKENQAFLKESGTDQSNLDALTKALAAIEKGLAGGFLQTDAAQMLRKLSISAQLVDMDRQTLVSFLSGSQEDGNARASDEIVGILKQMKDEMEKDLAEEAGAEASAAQSYEELMAAKKAEVETLTAEIETKMTRVGELGVEIATMKNDLEDTQEALAEDTKFLADLKKTCELKAKEWEVICKSRKEELIALSETIKILNDDDALELFKKALPSASFLQIQETEGSVRQRARAVLRNLAQNKSPQVDFIELTLTGKKVSFDKVIALIDEMVEVLKKEQIVDDQKKEYCDKEFDIAEDKKKELELDIGDKDKAIDETKEGLATVAEEITVLEESIKELDKSVAMATAQRKDEYADFQTLRAQNNAAKELILFAKNRMQKFYNPKLYKPPPKRELSEEERITLNMGGTLAPTNPPGGIAGTGVSFVQIRAHAVDEQQAPPPPPPAGPSAHKKKSEESGGVLAMMDMLVADLDKETLAAEMEEKDAQDDYQKLMGECSEKRATDSKDLTDKNTAKAEMEEELQNTMDAKEALGVELKATMDYLATLHGECDWLLSKYDERKEARTSEIDAMGKAKAVLNGADSSLVQTGERRMLRGEKQ